MMECPICSYQPKGGTTIQLTKDKILCNKCERYSPALDWVAEGVNAKDSDNNGGSTDYYKLDRQWKDAMDIVEHREMNYAQGNIFKVAFTFNIGRHTGTDEIRELNKIIYFAEREITRIKEDKQEVTFDEQS